MENNFSGTFNGQNGAQSFGGHNDIQPPVNNMGGAPESRCPVCHALVNMSQIFCAECGTSLKNRCVRCGVELEASQTFCVRCGQVVIDTPNPMVNGFNTAPAKKKNFLPFIIGGGVLTLIIVIVVAVLLCQKPSFAKMFPEYEGEEWCTMSSDGSYMRLDTNPDNVDSDYIDYTIYRDANDAIERVNMELGFSSSVYDDMNQTCWNDGKQTAENNKYIVTWTYHPDRGLEVKYEVK